MTTIPCSSSPAPTADERGQMTQTLAVCDLDKIIIPRDVAECASIRSGDTLTVRADGEGRLVLERVDPWAEFIGCMPGLEKAVDLQAMRDEWER